MKDTIQKLVDYNNPTYQLSKASEEFQELIDWNIIEAQNRLYFRCIEDINKNGAFDKNDKVHYHFVNLLSDEWKVEVYNPN